jgi:lipoprotein NlpI
VLAAAKDADLKKAAKQRCEAYFYLGQQALIAGQPDEARRLFQLALVPKLAGFTEYRGAQLELKRLPTAQAMR